MIRRSSFLLVLACAIVVAGCSRGGERAHGGTSPVSPTAAIAPSTSVSVQRGAAGTARPFDIVFPPRNESFEFRTQLETKYRDGLRRSSTSSFVDNEGDVVWTQEYIRYRVNTCDHNSAVQKVFSQIDGGGIPAVCGAAESIAGGLASVAFPPRNEPLDFRRQLETKYQIQLRRSPVATFVDLEGDIVWTQEYLRYRLSTCDHASSVLKVFVQIDGGGIQPDCEPPPPPPCAYSFSPTSQSVPASGGNFTVTATRTSGDCLWTTSSVASFITPTSATSGGSTTLGYSVAANPSPSSRVGTIVFDWSGGSAQITINQAGAPAATVFASFQMFDNGRQSAPTTECQFRSASGTPTTCTLNASSSFTSGRNVIVSYSWTVQYTYVTLKTLTQTSSNPIFSFTDTCGQLQSTDDGAIQPLSVQLTVTDDLGNTATVSAGTGSQPALIARLFICGK